LDWTGRRVLITGGAGFIGSNLARRLAKAGASVTCFDAFVETDGANPFNLAACDGEITVLRADVRNEEAVARALSGQEVLFNLAAQTSHMDSMQNPRADLEINALAQLGLVEACRRIAPGMRIVHVSTRQVYGRPRTIPVDETHPLAPPDVNAINKISGEFYHLLYGQVYGLRPTVLRLTNVYGPRMRVRDARQMFLGYWIGRACTGAPFEVWGGDQIRDLSFVENVVDALLASAADGTVGHTYNIGGEISLSLRELADMLVGTAPGASYVVKEFPPDRKRIDVGDYEADDSAFRSATGWRPRFSFEEGLRATLDFYRKHGQHYLDQ
jgi:nucleoside-diphosphate-sugar epimerase